MNVNSFLLCETCRSEMPCLEECAEKPGSNCNSGQCSSSAEFWKYNCAVGSFVFLPDKNNNKTPPF